MRSAGEVERVLKLAASGLTTRAITETTGVPFNTVRNWRAGQVPRRPQVVTDPAHHVAPVRDSYAYLLGLYLGDGHIAVHRRGVLRLVIYLDARYPSIIRQCEAAMGDVLPYNAIGRRERRGCVGVNVYSKSLDSLFPQHAAGPKHHRAIDLVDWQQVITREHPRHFLRGLIHSDGTRAINTVRSASRTYRYPRYQFANASQDIKDLFCEHCDLLGIEWAGDESQDDLGRPPFLSRANGRVHRPEVVERCK